MIENNSRIIEVDRIRVRERRKCCAARPREEGTHAVSKMRRAVCMKIAMKYNKKCNVMAREEETENGQLEERS